MEIQGLVGCVLMVTGALMAMPAWREKPSVARGEIERKPKPVDQQPVKRRAVVIIENENPKTASIAHVITEDSVWHWPVGVVRNVQIDAIYGDHMQKFRTRIPQDFEVRFGGFEGQEIAIIGKYCGFLLRADGSGYGWGSDPETGT